MAGNNQNNFDHDVFHLRDELLNLAAHIAAKYNGTQKVTEKTVVNLLLEHLCEKCITEKLKLGFLGENEIDRVWRNLHDYAVALLVERLKNELAACGFPISIFSEAENPTGRYDVLLLVDGKSIQIMNGKGNICLEAKTGVNISLIQSEKYIWNGATVMLVRFAKGDIIHLRASEWIDFVKLTLTNRVEKAKRILEGKTILVPGVDCRECPVKECRFNKNKYGRRELIRPRNLAELFENFRKNAYNAIESAVKAVVDELNMMLQGEANQIRE
ncbi:MAG: hypothetical protein RMJ15_11005 [Nitrososphaerota archaeon]|nr:hypothetical protein [Nitrososphaerota archaeon]